MHSTIQRICQNRQWHCNCSRNSYYLNTQIVLQRVHFWPSTEKFQTHLYLIFIVVTRPLHSSLFSLLLMPNYPPSTVLQDLWLHIYISYPPSTSIKVLFTNLALKQTTMSIKGQINQERKLPANMKQPCRGKSLTWRLRETSRPVFPDSFAR